MEPDKKMNKAVDDRIRKARAAWVILRKTLIANNEIDKGLKVNLFDSLIGSILLYGICLGELKTNTDKIQPFYSSCIRYLIHGRYESQKII